MSQKSVSLSSKPFTNLCFSQMSKILYFFFLKFQLSISQYVQFNVNVSFTYFLAVLNKKKLSYGRQAAWKLVYQW